MKITRLFWQRLLKVLFWLLLPAFGGSIAAVLLRFQLLKVSLNYELLTVFGIWLGIWGLVAYCSKRVFDPPPPQEQKPPEAPSTDNNVVAFKAAERRERENHGRHD